jgi:hypothetical protein
MHYRERISIHDRKRAREMGNGALGHKDGRLLHRATTTEKDSGETEGILEGENSFQQREKVARANRHLFALA